MAARIEAVESCAHARCACSCSPPTAGHLIGGPHRGLHDAHSARDIICIAGEPARKARPADSDRPLRPQASQPTGRRVGFKPLPEIKWTAEATAHITAASAVMLAQVSRPRFN